MGLRDLLIDVLNNYTAETSGAKFNGQHRMYQAIAGHLKEEMERIITRDDYWIKGSVGQGNWTNYPWFAIANKNITTNIQDGVYIVYLFSGDMERLYLTLIRGYTKLQESLGTRETIQELTRIRADIQSKISRKGFKTDSGIRVGKKEYEVGTIFYKEYLKSSMPPEQELIKDLKDMIAIYDEYYDKYYLKKENTQEENSNEDSGNMIKDMINMTHKYISSKGFVYSYSDLANFYLSLKIKPFVILAGISGTGKSKLVRLFSEAVGATGENNRFNMISVKPDWNDNTELLGYKNIEDKFIPGKLIKIIDDAMNNLDKPYFICLDEMNLARVEYYLSDYLSLIESKKFIDDKIVTDKIYDDTYFTKDEDKRYREFYIPENLYIVGTVNMDDTTFAFSRKVLDRANTIEFSNVDLENLNFDESDTVVRKLENSHFITRFLNIKDALSADEEYVKSINEKVVEVNNVLKSGNRHFGYRVRDEIVLYMLENKQSDLLDEAEAFDYQIMQKVLPAISGSDNRIKRILIGLFNICSPSGQIAEGTKYLEDAERYLPDALYKKSAGKIIDMLRGFDDGFTSYWI